MGLSLPHLLIVLIVILILFGAGRLPKVMEDLGKGLKSFKNAMHDNPPETTRVIQPEVTDKTTTTINTPENKEL